jgi:hypothetical protein
MVETRQEILLYEPQEILAHGVSVATKQKDI